MTTVTRRNALRTGTLAAIAAGLTCAMTVPPVAAAAAPIMVGTVANLDELTANVMQAHQEYERRADLLEAATTRLRGLLTDPAQTAAMLAYSDALSNLYVANETIVVQEIARHLPGLSLTVLALHDHVLDSSDPNCCRPTIG